jgi:flavin reductase (DIM6/NTAB) family NADH-FMN oxidoreductase RutF
MIYNTEDFKTFPQRYRANFFNSILGYKPANLIGTKNQAGIENLAIFSSAVHLGANPPLVGMVCRPDSVPRHTLENIRTSGYYTLNQVNNDIYQQAHQTSANYANDVSEFKAVGLTPRYIDSFTQPFVQESKVGLGLKLKEILPIQLNDTYFIIGEIVLVDIAESDITEDGSLDYTALNTSAVTGLDTYHAGRQLEKLKYARP